MNLKETDIALTDSSEKINLKIFQQLLADKLVLYAKAKEAASKVLSKDDGDHCFFKQYFSILNEVLTIVNGQIRKINFNYQGSLTQGLKSSILNVFDSSINRSECLIRGLLQDHNMIIKFIRKNLKNNSFHLNSNDSLDAIAEILQLHIEMTWMLRDQLIKIFYFK